MQNEITREQLLLDENGILSESGWARQPFWQYKRSAIQSPWHRIKEWDYYYALSDDLQKGIAITVSDLSYAGFIAVCWLDFEAGRFDQAEVVIPLSKGGLGLDEDSESSRVVYEHKDLSLQYEVKAGIRKLSVSAPNMVHGQGKGLKAQLTFESEQRDSLNIASRWAQQPKAFYYNRKVNCMKVTGRVVAGDQAFELTPDNAMGGLDWGRGVWTYRNRWYWASANGQVDGVPFGLNLGYGFSDRSHASENVVFYEGSAHKLADIEFPFDTSDYQAPWKTKSSDGRLELHFTPVLDRNSCSNLLVIQSEQHQVFGHFNGRFQLDSGDWITFDRILGFAEDVYNRF